MFTPQGPLRLGTGDVIPGMRALPAELRDAQRGALILIKLGIQDFSSYGMFSATSVSERFHVANFGRAPHPFFFLAPSRNRGSGVQGTRRQNLHTLAQNPEKEKLGTRERARATQQKRPGHVPIQTPLYRLELRGGNRVRKALDAVPSAWRGGHRNKGTNKKASRDGINVGALSCNGKDLGEIGQCCLCQRRAGMA